MKTIILALLATVILIVALGYVMKTLREDSKLTVPIQRPC